VLSETTEQPLDVRGGDDQSAELHARAAAVALVAVDSVAFPCRTESTY
jgi:hypothetical protein